MKQLKNVGKMQPKVILLPRASSKGYGLWKDKKNLESSNDELLKEKRY